MSRTNYGPTERLLLETVATEIYTDVVTRGSLPADDPLVTEESEHRAALDLLIDIGLLRHDDDEKHYFPADPATIQAQIVVPLGQQGAELLSESAQWADAFTTLGQTFRTSPHLTEHPITEIRGLGNIDNFIRAAVSDCRKELMTAQPEGRRPPSTLAVAAERDVRALERGIAMRTLYQHSARHSPATREYVEKVSAHGGEVRTLDEFFRRLIVVDRHVAIIPGSERHDVAVAIHEKSLIAYIVDIFERSWERALPFTASGSQTERNIASDVRALTIRMLVEGHSDSSSAKRLGVSTRTYAGYIAALKEEYAVQTRFQLGHAMGREEITELAPVLDDS